VKEREGIIHLVEFASDFLEELKDDLMKESAGEILQRIITKLDSLYRIEEVVKEKIILKDFLEDLCTQAIRSMNGRRVEIVRRFREGICVEISKDVLRKVWGGLLRNAIENTPDEGRIEVWSDLDDSKVIIAAHDFGVGITPENQKMVFGGFFHTQDTFRYASRKPYSFNAGGCGADLLRAKVFSERLGFSIHFSSTRCRYLPSDTDECSGSISSCPFIKNRHECFSAGQTIFSLHFPMESFLVS
jgi:signal transduction histidine kinase